MIALNDVIPLDHIVQVEYTTPLLIPFYAAYVQAGFPSPAENYIDKVCSLDELCITNAEATYFVRVASDSMIGDRIDRGDVLVVDCSRKALDGKIVVVWLNGDHTVKRIHYVDEMVVLVPSNPAYEPIYVHPGDDFKVMGVVTSVIQRLI